MNFTKPKKLNPGDTVAVVSPSWGGPSVFPTVYENGLKVLKEWGLKIKEFPTARADADYLRANPAVRAKDVSDAFADPEVKAIITAIGGNDSVRILPFLDKKIIAENPKIFMGYSDTSTIHTFCNQLGITTFYGPAIMAGFSQMKALEPRFKEHVRSILFEPQDNYEYAAYEKYCDGYPNWVKPENLGKVNELKPNDGWHWIQGNTKIQGQLYGGCIEVLEMLKGTEFWPAKELWKDKILFLETSEEKPTLHFIDHALRNYGMLGVFDMISGLIFSRARDYSDDEKKKLEELITTIVANEFGHVDLPIVANFDVGHADPQFVLPLGVNAEIDCKSKKISLVEPWLI